MRSFVNIITSSKILKKDDGKQEIILYIKPDFRSNGKDIMIKGGNFYAMLNDKTNMWITNESEAIELIDRKMYEYRDKISVMGEDGKYYTKDGKVVKVECLDSSITNQLFLFRKWIRTLPINHNYVKLDEEITLPDEVVTPEMYRSRRLKYNIADGPFPNYDKLISKLYSPEDRLKIEWVIGSIFTGDSKKIEKLMVLYGDKGTGKSTILDLMKDLFDGYYGVFVAADLANKSNAFSTEFLKTNPLVSIQDDGTLSKIDTPLINEIVSHKEIVINEKNTKHYSMKMDTFLVLATNEKVDIHDTKMGITRRLLDVYPTGDKFPVKEYRVLVANMKFELGAIAKHCIDVFKEYGKEYYINYVPKVMINKTNYIRNFIFDNYEKFVRDSYYTRDVMYKWYKEYCDESGIPFIQKRIDFGEQIGEYFKEYYDIKHIDNTTKRHVFMGFKEDMFKDIVMVKKEVVVPDWLKFDGRVSSTFDKLYSSCPAQYANEEEVPLQKWSDVTTTLKDIDTRKLHYVKPPENLICIDFDIKDEKGNKDEKKNLLRAAEWPETYGEYSKSGSGVHLYYIYTGDTSKLKAIYDKDIEVKTFRGKAALRRKLSKCNSLDIAIISSGLPMKGDKVINDYSVKNDKHLRALICKALRKEVEPHATKTCMDYILKVTDDAYNSGLHYDVTDMRPDIMVFANNSTHNAAYCLNILNKIHWSSDEAAEDAGFVNDNDPIIFYDVEVFENLFMISFKEEGEGKEVITLTNPTPSDVEELSHRKLVGFNNRSYDNHILYARIMGYNNYQLYELSRRLIAEGDKTAKFSEAYKLSYADVYDFVSKKQGLKKWEIELGISHQELGIPWDKPVPKDKWDLVAEYNKNDVIATEAVWNHRKADFATRKILASLSGLTVNDSNLAHITRIISGGKKEIEHVYTDLSTLFPGYEFKQDQNGKWHNMYRGTDVGFGGYVYSEPGIYYDVSLCDVGNMHGASIIALNKFGENTKIYEEIRSARMAVKKRDFEKASKMLGGALAPYLTSDEAAGELEQALKLILNSTYGIAAATFNNVLRDPRDKNNIIALRGALFMRTLQDEIVNKGYKVVHIKTDSCKVPMADKKIIDFIMKFGEKYGYEFEHEAIYEKMCLVNDAAYIAKYADPDTCMRNYGYVPKDNKKHPGEWTATATQFQIPYVFKILFSHETITFEDMCETKQVNTAIYLDMNEDLKEGEHDYVFVGKVGQFTPVKPGCGGGILLRQKKDDEESFDAVTGTKKKGTKDEVYRWMESEVLKSMPDYMDMIDTSYFNDLANAAIDTINKFGDFDEFVSDELSFMRIPNVAGDEYDFMNPPV